jgi:hypothetical protein
LENVQHWNSRPRTRQKEVERRGTLLKEKERRRQMKKIESEGLHAYGREGKTGKVCPQVKNKKRKVQSNICSL